MVTQGPCCLVHAHGMQAVRPLPASNPSATCPWPLTCLQAQRKQQQHGPAGQRPAERSPSQQAGQLPSSATDSLSQQPTQPRSQDEDEDGKENASQSQPEALVEITYSQLPLAQRLQQRKGGGDEVVQQPAPPEPVQPQQQAQAALPEQQRDAPALQPQQQVSRRRRSQVGSAERRRRQRQRQAEEAEEAEAASVPSVAIPEQLWHGHLAGGGVAQQASQQAQQVQQAAQQGPADVAEEDLPLAKRQRQARSTRPQQQTAGQPQQVMQHRPPRPPAQQAQPAAGQPQPTPPSLQQQAQATTRPAAVAPQQEEDEEDMPLRTRKQQLKSSQRQRTASPSPASLPLEGAVHALQGPPPPALHPRVQEQEQQPAVPGSRPWLGGWGQQQRQQQWAGQAAEQPPLWAQRQAQWQQEQAQQAHQPAWAAAPPAQMDQRSPPLYKGWQHRQQQQQQPAPLQQQPNATSLVMASGGGSRQVQPDALDGSCFGHGADCLDLASGPSWQGSGDGTGQPAADAVQQQQGHAAVQPDRGKQPQQHAQPPLQQGWRPPAQLPLQQQAPATDVDQGAESDDSWDDDAVYGAQPARPAPPPPQQQQRVSIQQQQQPTLRPAQPQSPAHQGQQVAQQEEFSFHPALPPQHTHTPQQWRPLAGGKAPVEEAGRLNGDAGMGPDATPASEPSGVLPAGRRRAAFVVADSQTPEWQPAAAAGGAAAAAGRRKAAFVIDDSQTPVDLAGARRQPAVPVADSDASPASLPQPQQQGGGGNLRRLQRGGVSAGAAAAAAGGRGAGTGQPGLRAAAVAAAGGNDARAAQRRRQEQLLWAQERKQRRADARKRAASFLDVEAGLSGDDDSGAAGPSSVLPNASPNAEVAPMSWGV